MTNENTKTKLSEIEEIPINDFSKLSDLIKKHRYGLGVNLSHMRHIKEIKDLFKSFDYALIQITINMVYFYMLLIAVGALVLENYFLLFALPILFIFKNSGIIDTWIIGLVSVLIFIVVMFFWKDNRTLHFILYGVLLTYSTSKIAFYSFTKKLKEKSLKSERDFCLLFQMVIITITDNRKNEIYKNEENNKST